MIARRLSVVVPVHEGAGVLPQSLRALANSDLPREQWELIVVDDGSTDESARIAEQHADRVVRLGGGAHGPAFARNRGVEASTGEWIVFVDADVVVHADTLSRIVRIIERDESIDAVMGAYDERPSDPGFLSQYRNLLHRYTHIESSGEAETFWAGLGAVRRSAFMAVGGFDESRYSRPQIEDIELGYRLRDAGYRIVLDPSVEGTHLKRWTFAQAVRTDVWDRGVPWVRLLLERSAMTKRSTLNLKGGERLKAIAAVLGAAMIVLAILTRSTLAAWIGVAVIGFVVLLNSKQLAWFSARRGVWFGVRVGPMIVWYYLLSAACVALGLGAHLLHGRYSRPEKANHMSLPSTPIRDPLTHAFLPMHKAAFGIATGLATGFVIVLATLATIGRAPASDFGIHLLGEYFAGYTVSVPGAFIGGAWGVFTGFVMGWFVAFARNVSVGIFLLFIRTRAELAQSRDFLDHI
jgi:glycosyltransferase involved in cell wall biosynthesis